MGGPTGSSTVRVAAGWQRCHARCSCGSSCCSDGCGCVGVCARSTHGGCSNARNDEAQLWAGSTTRYQRHATRKWAGPVDGLLMQAEVSLLMGKVLPIQQATSQQQPLVKRNNACLLILSSRCNCSLPRSTPCMPLIRRQEKTTYLLGCGCCAARLVIGRPSSRHQPPFRPSRRPC
jgi:hypothetical protein